MSVRHVSVGNPCKYLYMRPLVLSFEKNCTKKILFCCITVKFEVEQGKTSGCSPIVFSSPQVYAKVTFKVHIWEEKLGRHKNTYFSYYSDSSTYTDSDC